MFLHKCQRVEGFFNKYNRREGVMGKSALSPSSLALRNRGGRRTPPAALGLWPEGSRAAGVMGKREVGPLRVHFPL